uniref:Uncharacterized protein n=1 Tax=Nyssomyia neivai TaxID=330878 RepID=A0A1L8D717_9DIPT
MVLNARFLFFLAFIAIKGLIAILHFAIINQFRIEAKHFSSGKSNILPGFKFVSLLFFLLADFLFLLLQFSFLPRYETHKGYFCLLRS